MKGEDVKQSLVTIIGADLRNDSRFMGDKKTSTIGTRNIYRASLTTLIRQHHGRGVDSPGDNP